MNASLTCPRCKTENVAAQRFCQKCGFGLYKTDSLEPPPELLGERPEDTIGKVIAGKYRVLSVLGEGGFGVVFKVEQMLLGRNLTFALKLLHRELTENEHFRARFVREASIAMELVHPSAIQVRDFGVTENDQLYFTMDFCKGESLKDLLAREGYLTVNRAVHIVREILTVLEVAHEKQFIHRDVKPENIFIERENGVVEEQVKVGDFGLARNVSQKSGSNITKGGIVGTPRYMSPEQSKGEALDGRSDLYAVGVVFYEMISGDVPPRLDRKRKPGQSGVEISPQARLRENLPDGVVVPGAVLDIIARSLETKPGDRFRNATEFRESIDLLPTYTPTYIEPRGEQRRAWPGRTSSWITAAVLLFAAFLVFTPAGQELLTRVRSTAFGKGPDGGEGDRRSSGDSRSGDPKRDDGTRSESNDSRANGPSGQGSERSEDSDSSGNANVGEGAESEDKSGASGDATHPDAGAPKPGDQESDSPKPAQPPKAEPRALGELEEWVPFRPSERLAVDRTRVSPNDPTESRTERVIAKIGTVSGMHGYAIEAEGEPRRFWSTDDQEFRETFVSPVNPAETTEWIYLKWNPETNRPAEEWQSNGYRFRVSEEVRPQLAVDGRYFRNLIEVVGEADGGRIMKCYFERGSGLVVKERYQVEQRPEGEVEQFQFREVRILDGNRSGD
ncbi:MAG: protein kinase [Planctomycetota bacterium]